MGPNTAFILFVFGMLGIYAELVWPGRFVPGIVGLASVLTGAFLLFRAPLNPEGVVLLAVAAILLLAEARWGPYFLFGSLGTIALVLGFCFITDGPRRIRLALAIPVALVFGACSLWLATGAKRARRNKWSDLGGAK